MSSTRARFLIRNACGVCFALALAFARPAAQAQTWQPGSFLYQLQNLNVSNAAASPFPVIVTDYSHDGSAVGELTSNEVATLKAGVARRRYSPT